MTEQNLNANNSNARWQPDRIPTATYRLQFNQDWTFEDAERLVPYLHDLGISAIYASPILQPREGSTHGYDIANTEKINPALGGAAGLTVLHQALKKRGMGLIVDIVPNHMGVNESTNTWWLDVLENGPSSDYAHYFDIDWKPVKRELENKVLLPVLEDQYGRVLEDGKLKLVYENNSFALCYYDMLLPIAPRTYQGLVQHILEQIALPDDNDVVLEIQSIQTALGYLPSRLEQSKERLAERNREKEIIKRRLATAYEQYPEVQSALDTTIEHFNGQPGKAESFDLLDQLINIQPYRLAFWRVAAEEINYRRFFDINELAAIRVEEPDVFEATHRLIFEKIKAGQITGLRIDHPDGLWNPPVYFQALQDLYSEAFSDKHGLYVVAEKILAEHESLPENWQVAGTTGYDFLNVTNGLFVDKRRRKIFDKIYSTFIGTQPNITELIITKKKMIMRRALVSEMNALSHQLQRIIEKNRRYRDFTLYGLTATLREVIACLQIYRTYITKERHISERDRFYINSAVNEAQRRNPELADSLFDFIRETLVLDNLTEFHESDQDDIVEFIMKFQQISSPVMAKSVEDTAFYIYNRLVSLNEVGGHPEEFGTTRTAFHRHNTTIQEQWPHSMLCSSTHDTKRSEDVRARINVISEMPDEWKSAIRRWSKINAKHKTPVEGVLVPDRNDEYLLYQTLIGAWPLGIMNTEQFATFRQRIIDYMHKATKEAKVHTSWVNPNEKYDNAVHTFIEHVLDRQRNRGFIHDFLRLQQRITYYSYFNALSQTALKLTVPGVPDIYQGNELWDWSLVDPDNRRPVDYEQRRALLDAIKNARASASLAQQLLETIDNGSIKMFITQRALHLRRLESALFSRGTYSALATHGPQERYAIAFARIYESKHLIVVVPRLIIQLTDGVEQPPLGEEIWNESRVQLPTTLTTRSLRNILTGETVNIQADGEQLSASLAEVFKDLPIAFLVNDETATDLWQPPLPKRVQRTNKN